MASPLRQFDLGKSNSEKGSHNRLIVNSRVHAEVVLPTLGDLAGADEDSRLTDGSVGNLMVVGHQVGHSLHDVGRVEIRKVEFLVLPVRHRETTGVGGTLGSG